MTFRSDRIIDTGEGWNVEGRLTIGSLAQPFTLDVRFGGVAPYIDSTLHAGFSATGALRRTDFGIDLPGGIPSTMLSDVVEVQLDIQLVEPS